VRNGGQSQDGSVSRVVRSRLASRSSWGVEQQVCPLAFGRGGRGALVVEQPCTRAEFIMVNMYERPWCGSPTIADGAGFAAGAVSALAEVRQRVRGAAATELVVEAGEDDVIALRAGSVVVDEELRDDERLMPFTPGGPPGIFASTRCTMFSDSSWSQPCRPP
jgi:hypothetical protein